MDIDAEEVPDAKTILKIARVLGPDAIQQLHQRVVEVAKRAGVTHGRRFRIDTTVVETNVHYPTELAFAGWRPRADDARCDARVRRSATGVGACGTAGGVWGVAC